MAMDPREQMSGPEPYERVKPLDLMTHDELVAKADGPYGRVYLLELERRARKNTPAPFLMERTPTPKDVVKDKYMPPPDPLERIANALERIADKIDGWSYIGDQN